MHHRNVLLIASALLLAGLAACKDNSAGAAYLPSPADAASSAPDVMAPDAPADLTNASDLSVMPDVNVADLAVTQAPDSLSPGLDVAADLASDQASTGGVVGTADAGAGGTTGTVDAGNNDAPVATGGTGGGGTGGTTSVGGTTTTGGVATGGTGPGGAGGTTSNGGTTTTGGTTLLQGVFATTGSMTTERDTHTATLLREGDRLSASQAQASDRTCPSPRPNRSPRRSPGRVEPLRRNGRPGPYQTLHSVELPV